MMNIFLAAALVLAALYAAAGRAAVRVRIKFTAVDIPLSPGHPPAKLGWSEMRYTAYCYRMPEAK